MRHRLADIKKPASFEEPVAAMVLELGYQFEARVAELVLSMDVEPAGQGHRMSGSFDYEAWVPCSRCLRETLYKGTSRFRTEYRMASSRPASKEIDVAPEEDDVAYTEDGVLVPEEIVTQQLILDLPEKPLCDEECRGLCPRCGSDLNEAPCGCAPDEGALPVSLADFRAPMEE